MVLSLAVENPRDTANIHKIDLPEMENLPPAVQVPSNKEFCTKWKRGYSHGLDPQPENHPSVQNLNMEFKIDGVCNTRMRPSSFSEISRNPIPV